MDGKETVSSPSQLEKKEEKSQVSSSVNIPKERKNSGRQSSMIYVL